MPMLMLTARAQAAHAAIGLGELPGKPIVMYLVHGICLVRRIAAAVGGRSAPVPPGDHASGRGHFDRGHLREHPDASSARSRELHSHRRCRLLALLPPDPLAANPAEKGITYVAFD